MREFIELGTRGIELELSIIGIIILLLILYLIKNKRDMKKIDDDMDGLL